MQTEIDIYGHELKLSRKIERIKKLKSISEKAKKKILQFQEDCLANGLSAARILRYLDDLPRIAQLLDNKFEKPSVDDIKKVVREIDKKDISPVSKQEFKKTIKKFYKWLNGSNEYPSCVQWIKSSRKLNNNKLPEELLTEEEVKKMINASGNPRDRAIIATLWESGCRAGEMLLLRIKHVSFEETLTKIVVQGKTGMRRIPLLDSTPYLTDWIENHPLKENPNAPLWVGMGNVGRNERLCYPALRKLLKEAARKAGIKKSVNPHSFRHSRATRLANHLTEAQMTQYFGWVQGSDIPRTYVHLSGRDVDEAILKMRGLKPKEEKVESSLAPKNCPRCGLINKATGKFCTRCAAVLDVETALAMQDEMEKLDEKFSKLLEDKKVQNFLIKRMIELGIK